MSLYDESIEIVEYQEMVKAIKVNREALAMASETSTVLADRPDIVIDHNGDLWTLAPVTRNYGLPLPVFYRFTYVPTRSKVNTDRPQAARKVRYPNGRLWDEAPKTAKVKR